MMFHADCNKRAGMRLISTFNKPRG